MFCCKCGKEISDQAQFCNFCGAQITGTQSGTAVAAQPAQQPDEPKQERKAGKGILSVLVAVVVFFGVRYATENFLFSKKPDTASKTTTTTSSSGRIEINKPSPASTCYLGGLYQGGELIYGSAKLRIPGYSLLPGEGDAVDFLMSPDGTVLVSVNKTLEVNVSYDASDEARLLKSFDNSGFANVRMIDFRKDTDRLPPCSVQPHPRTSYRNIKRYTLANGRRDRCRRHIRCSSCLSPQRPLALLP